MGVMDNIKAGVLDAAPPILARSFQDLASGLETYHEARKLARVPLPFAYTCITVVILVAQSIFMPFVIASMVQGVISAFVFTSGGIFLLWYVNGVAESLSNPFTRVTKTLKAHEVQGDLNGQLEQLAVQFYMPTPTMEKLNLDLDASVCRKNLGQLGFLL